MSDLGPIYPFEPLPPPENPSTRAGNVRALNINTKTENQQIGKTESKHTRDIAFNRLLQSKTETLENSTNAISEEETKKIQEVAKDLEAFFVYMILKSFNKTLIDGGLFPKEAGASLYMDMFFEGVANETSKSPNGLGLADEIVKSIELNLAQSMDKAVKREL